MAELVIEMAPAGEQYLIELFSALAIGGVLRREALDSGPWVVEVRSWPNGIYTRPLMRHEATHLLDAQRWFAQVTNDIHAGNVDPQRPHLPDWSPPGNVEPD